MAIQYQERMCLSCHNDFLGRLEDSLCPQCRSTEKRLFNEWLDKLTQGKDLEQIVMELAKRVYQLENRKPRYAPLPVYGGR
jgi:Zn finger protein HypA/HybF involved in hydrogenase expression